MKWKLPPRYRINKKSVGLALALSGVLAYLLSCGQNYNSNTHDSDLGGGISCPSDPNLCVAYAVIKTNHCFECHSWSTYKTDDAWKSSGLVQAGNPSGSLLITKLKNSGGDMPQNYSAISSGDLQSLTTWIQGL